MLSYLVLLSYDAPDLMMAGGAVFAMLCGLVLMGGRSFVGRPLRMLSSFRHRSLSHEPVICAEFSLGAGERPVSDLQVPGNRAA